MLRKLGGIWVVFALALGFVLGVSGLAVASPAAVAVLAEGDQDVDAAEPSDSVDSPDASGSEEPGEAEPAPEPEPEPEPEPDVVSASVSADEKVVSLKASGPSLADATDVVFSVWNQNLGKGSLIQHEAVKQGDGSWVATAYIASNSFDDPGVPYSCRVRDAVHRLYNPYTAQHLFTSDLNEADTLSRSGWRYEGVAWVQAQPSADAAVARKPVYRLYNAYTGDHFFTLNRAEYDSLAGAGWRQEGVAFYSDSDAGVTVYRVYNPYLSVGSHLYTSSANEYRTLVGSGWRDEGISWYGDDLNGDGTWSALAQNRFHDSAGSYRVEAVATVVPSDEPKVEQGSEPVVDPTTDPSTDTDADASTGTDADAPTDSVTNPDDESVAEATALAASQKVTIGEASFSISQPSASAHIANVDNAHGTYDVVVSGIRSVSGIAHVQVPTWTDKGGQDDLVWYEAARQGDGSYKATVNIGRHSFEHDFTSHVYLRAGNGLTVNVAQLSQHLTLANFIRKSGGPYLYTISIYNPGSVSKVQMPTWSDQNGQDDIIWFDASDNGNGWWSATIDASRLLHSGVVHVHVYGDGQFLTAVPDFTIQPWEILEWRFRNMNDRIWNLSSPTNWLLAVDTSNCFVGVYRGSRGSWANQHWWDCAPGTAATPTVKGVFSIGSRGSSFGHGYTCYWWTQFYEDYWFHSIKYYEGTYNVLDGTLGAPASLGCVRLAIGNAKWIHDNIPSGTTVLVY